MSKLNNELSTMFAQVTLPSDEEIARDTAYAKISDAKLGIRRPNHSEKMKGRKSGKKGTPSGKKGTPSPIKGKPRGISPLKGRTNIREYKQATAETKQLMSLSHKGKSLGTSKYTFSTPKGEYSTQNDVIIAYADEYTARQLTYLCRKCIKGFSRTLKPIDA